MGPSWLGEDVKRVSSKILCKLVTHRGSPILTPWAYLNNCGRRPIDNVIYGTKYESSGHCGFWKYYLFSDHKTNLCNQLELFEQLWTRTTKIEWAISEMFKKKCWRTTDGRQRWATIAQPEHSVLRWAKKEVHEFYLTFSPPTGLISCSSTSMRAWRDINRVKLCSKEIVVIVLQIYNASPRIH